MIKGMLKTAAIATAVMLFTSCKETEEIVDATSGNGMVEISILGEDILYSDLKANETVSQFLANAAIDTAYMLVKDPQVHAGTKGRHAGHIHGEGVEGVFAVDLMSKGTTRTPIVLGTDSIVKPGSYEYTPSLVLPRPSATDWAKVVDKGGKTALQTAGATFIMKGSITDLTGKTYRFEVIEPLENEYIAIQEIPLTPAEGQMLIVENGKTLKAEFHPHIDHALEVLDAAEFDFATLSANGTKAIVISPTSNATMTDKKGTIHPIYSDIIDHLKLGSHWDVNVIP